MSYSISNDRSEESFSAKAAWFQSLSYQERMEVFVGMMDMLIELNPSILEAKDAQPIPDVFASLNSHEVNYVVIGGIAAVVHGVPRATFDLDILIEASRDNAARLLLALEEAGLGTALLTDPDEVLRQDITIFKDRVRIDVQTHTPGLVFAEAWGHRLTLQFGGQTIELVSLDDLIKSKRASARPVDLEDVRSLEQNADRGDKPQQ